MGLPMMKATKVYMDNKSAIELCSTLKSTYKTSAINMRINFIRECINRKIISLHFISTEKNVADLLTKALGVDLLQQHRFRILHGFEKEFFDFEQMMVVTEIVEHEEANAGIDFSL